MRLSREKILDNDRQLSNFLKTAKRPLVFTNGCFDILHRGHVTYLEQAAGYGKQLLVALNNDDSVRRLNKTAARPINPLTERMAVIAGLAAVDWVISFAEDTPLRLIIEIEPDVLVKGGDWPVTEIVGATEVCARGGTVYSIPFRYKCSTTKLIEKIRR